MECITSTSLSILINGKAHGYFYPSRGIRQGDPLSLYIFILCMKPLIRHFNALAFSPRTCVGLLTSPRGFKVSNLMSADLCLIFAKASKGAARIILNVLNTFASTSRQKININKSCLYFSKNTTNHVRNEVGNIIKIQHKTTIGKYLGINNIICWKDPVNTKDITLKIKNKLVGWKVNTFPRDGRFTLIKANLSSMPNHMMMCFKCLDKFTKMLDKENKNFLWGKDSELRHVAWNKVCQPKCNGGLGIRKSSLFNNACLAKLGWKMIKIGGFN